MLCYKEACGIAGCPVKRTLLEIREGPAIGKVRGRYGRD